MMQFHLTFFISSFQLSDSCYKSLFFFHYVKLPFGDDWMLYLLLLFLALKLLFSYVYKLTPALSFTTSQDCCICLFFYMMWTVCLNKSKIKEVIQLKWDLSLTKTSE